MKNSTPFLDELMKNSIQEYIILDLGANGTADRVWQFEEYCLDEHSDLTREEFDEWYQDYVIELKAQYILFNITIKDGRYDVAFINTYSNMGGVYDRIGNAIASHIDMDAALDRYLPEEEYDFEPSLNEQILEFIQSDAPIPPQTFETEYQESLEEITLLNDTIKDMEAQIKKLETILEFTWTMLENKIKDTK